MIDRPLTPGDVEGGQPLTSPWTWLAFASLAVATFAFELWLGRDASFWHDECDFLHHRALADPLTWFIPHNDHAVVLPAVAYRILVDLAGTKDYLPFLALLQVAHITTAAGLFAILLPRSALLAFGAAAVFLLLGSGGDNLFWAFQITFVGSTAFGTWALWAAERRRWTLASALLVGSVFCSLVGVPFLLAAGVIALARERRGIVWLVPPTVLLVVWWAIFGRGWVRPAAWATTEFGSPASIESWSLVPGYVVKATMTTLAGLSGQGYGGAVLIVIALTWAAIVASFGGWRPSPWQLGVAAGFVVFVAMVGVIRATNPAGFTPRYVYVAGLLILLLLPAIRNTRVSSATAVVILAFALTGNLITLVEKGQDWAMRTNGELACLP